MGAGRSLRPQTFTADLEIGASKLQGQIFHAVETGEQMLLGLSALAAFELQVFPGERVLFRPRARDLRATAAARVRRWPWMPPCAAAVGCVRATIEGEGKDARVAFDVDASLPRPVRVLLGCAGGAAPDWIQPFGLQDDAAPLHHVELELRGDIPRAFSYPVPDIEAQLVSPDGRRCRALAVLDVMPLPPDGRRVDEARMSFFP
jgi:hypothetical protein